jgi:hypothetical protein
MRTAKIFLCGLTAILCTYCAKSQIFNEVTPVIAGKYSDTEIDSLIRAYASLPSRDATPSQALQQKFAKDFPNAHDVEWETAESIFEVELELGYTDYKAYYDKEGNLLMYGYEVRESKLPAAVRDAAKALYPKYRFDDIKKVHKGTAVFYKVEMERRDSEVKMVIKSDGSLVENWVD